MRLVEVLMAGIGMDKNVKNADLKNVNVQSIMVVINACQDIL